MANFKFRKKINYRKLHLENIYVKVKKAKELFVMEVKNTNNEQVS